MSSASRSRDIGRTATQGIAVSSDLVCVAVDKMESMFVGNVGSLYVFEDACAPKSAPNATSRCVALDAGKTTNAQ